ncbi:MAG: AI-2E family transporter [Ruminococcaceae bacterium]|nr:AI-2E family transporter [Oscillospiraceae bacterium]
MKTKILKGYLPLFIIGVLLIAVYKTFDNFGIIIDFFRTLMSILTPFAVGFVIALLLYPLCAKIEKLLKKCKMNFISKNRRGITVATTFVILIGIIALVMYFVVPPLAKSIRDFAYQFPYILESISQYVKGFGIKIDYEYLKNIFTVDKIMQHINLESINEYAAGVASFSASFVKFFMGIIVSVYVLIDREKLVSGAKRILKAFLNEKKYFRISRYVKMATEFIYKYLYCLIIDAVIIFILSFIILSILKVKYAHLLALMLGVFNLVPYFGAIVASATTAIITCFTANFTMGVIVAVALIILQQIDANVIQPNLVNNSFAIRPFWVIFAILVGGNFFGIIGILLAVPTFALVRVLFLELLDKKESSKKIIAEENNA